MLRKFLTENRSISTRPSMRVVSMSCSRSGWRSATCLQQRYGWDPLNVRMVTVRTCERTDLSMPTGWSASATVACRSSGLRQVVRGEFGLVGRAAAKVAGAAEVPSATRRAACLASVSNLGDHRGLQRTRRRRDDRRTRNPERSRRTLGATAFRRAPRLRRFSVRAVAPPA